VLEQLRQLAGNSTAAVAGNSSGKRYRSLICTNVRNDLHLREFLVRNLLLGFSHIVVLDNNQCGRDHNTSLLLQPFVQVGEGTAGQQQQQHCQEEKSPALLPAAFKATAAACRHVSCSQ
jgi:hypothetical protein